MTTTEVIASENPIEYKGAHEFIRANSGVEFSLGQSGFADRNVHVPLRMADYQIGVENEGRASAPSPRRSWMADDEWSNSAGQLIY